MSNKIKMLLSLILFFISQSIQAQLIISPTRVVLDERQRSAKVVLINPTNKERTYRIEWEEKLAKSTGGYETIEGNQLTSSSLRIASPMIRISPRQVTLQPNEKQSVRLMFRRPKELLDAEYRSHLAFKPISTRHKNSDHNSNGMQIRVEPLLGFTIPIIARQGKLEASVNVSDVKVVKNKQQTSAQLILTIDKSGKYSTTGNMLIYWQPSSNAYEQVVAQVHGYNIYPDQSQYKLNLEWPNFTAKKGHLRIVYSGQKEFNGQVFVDKTFDLPSNLVIE